jgi:hypothetical protein
MMYVHEPRNPLRSFFDNPTEHQRQATDGFALRARKENRATRILNRTLAVRCARNTKSDEYWNAALPRMSKKQAFFTRPKFHNHGVLY